MSTYRFQQGQSPLVISMPHNGVQIPQGIQANMTPVGHRSSDTDWYLDQLYHFVFELDFSVIYPHYSRYVVDLNRDPEGKSLYPDSDTTGICPVSSFTHEALYQEGLEPTEEEIHERIRTYWRPYHTFLTLELGRLSAKHPRVVLFDAHSIAPVVPRFFEGTLPDINIGTNGGESCAPELEKALCELAESSGYTWVSNGRFKGGYITRHYAKPEAGIHTVQLELSQATYMNLETQQIDPEKAAQVQVFLQAWIETLYRFTQDQLTES